MESEKDGSLQFLDTVVQKNNDVFDLDMFHKPTETGLYLSWSSLISKVYEISLIKCLTHRILVICSKTEFVKKQLDRLKSCFLTNSYPTIVVEGTMAGEIDKQGISKAPVIDVPKLKVFMKLPYIGPESLKLKKQILTLFRYTFNSAELSIVFKAGSTIGQMFPFKDGSLS